MVDTQLSTTRRWLLDNKRIVDPVDMAGYDFIIEISRSMIERMTVRNVVAMFTPRGEEPVLPFELTYDFSVSGFEINFHAIVEDIKIDLVEDDYVQATIVLEKMSVDNKGEIMLTGLSGNLIVKIPIVLDDLPDDDLSLQIDLPKASVAFSFSDDSRRYVVDYISMFPDYSIDDVESGFETPVLDALKKEGPFKLFVFKVDPENDGSLEPLRFSSLEVHTMPNAKREKQSIALLGSFSPDRQGDFSTLPSSTVQVQNNADFSFRVSKDAFIDMVLNKGLEEFFPSYATSGEIAFDTGTDLETMYITGIKCDFQENRNGGLIYFSGRCYANANIACVESIEATFGLHFRLLTENGAIKFESCNIDIEPDVSLSWYCLIIGLLGVIAAIVLDILEEEMFKPDATNNLRAMIQKFCETMSIKKNFGKFAIEFKDIFVLSDQVFAGGTIGGADALPARVQPSLDLEVTEQHAWSKVSNQTT
nr:hypothetical protein [Candidatus Sigynarchaeota archaeon]